MTRRGKKRRTANLLVSNSDPQPDAEEREFDFYNPPDTVQLQRKILFLDGPGIKETWHKLWLRKENPIHYLCGSDEIPLRKEILKQICLFIKFSHPDFIEKYKLESQLMQWAICTFGRLCPFSGPCDLCDHRKITIMHFINLICSPSPDEKKVSETVNILAAIYNNSLEAVTQLSLNVIMEYIFFIHNNEVLAES